ncbi:MAG: alpha/beta hydrolase [Anaerolineaceae bacterium]|nr:alpha/beta hydrolase [Anaerolineaceae bacterium]
MKTKRPKIFGDDPVFALSSAFSDTSLIPLLPYVIYEVANDNFDALDEISAEEGFARTRYQDDEDRSDSEGMYNSVICHDEYALGDYERVETAVVGNIPPELEGALLQATADLTNLCQYWNPMRGVDNTAVSSNIPTLILVGQYDVATPPRWATLTAATLPNSTVVLVPGAGHSCSAASNAPSPSPMSSWPIPTNRQTPAAWPTSNGPTLSKSDYQSDQQLLFARPRGLTQEKTAECAAPAKKLSAFRTLCG